MGKMVSFRPGEEMSAGLEKIMKENAISKSEAIRFLYDHYKEISGAIPPQKKSALIKVTTDMDNAINRFKDSKEAKEVRRLLEDLRCQIL